MNPYDPQYLLEKHQLRWQQCAQQIVLDEGLFLRPEISLVERREVLGQFLLRMVTHILTDELPPETVRQSTFLKHEVPASTWQMFKKRHADSWWLRRLVARWPVEYVQDWDGRGTQAICEFDLRQYHTYPRANIVHDRLGSPVLKIAIGSPRWGVHSVGDE